MSKILVATLPKTPDGNDPNDHRNDTGYLSKVEIKEPVSALDSLLALSSTNRLTEMEANLKNDVYVFQDLALSGQITLFYGWPNTGKTIFFLRFITDAIRDGRIQAGKVVYVNADDSYKGLFTKTKVAAEYGFHMVSPAESGVSPQEILDRLENIAKANQADGIVILLDTLKKFADMMSKRSQADLYVILRKLIAKGGTVIIAGHANKHKDAEGNLIYEGTSDTMNDIDCAYSMYRMSKPDDEIQIVEFRREKDRGDVIPKVTYQYQKGNHYLDMVKSITCLDAEVADKLIQQEHHRELKEKYEAELLFVTELLRVNSSINQTAILKALKEDTELSGEITIRSLRSALKQLDGITWTSKRGTKNARTYALIGQEACQYNRATRG